MSVAFESVASEPAAVSRSRVKVRFARAVRLRLTRRALLVLGCRLTILVSLLLAWENFAGPRDRSGVLIDEFYVSKPSAIWDAIVGWSQDGLLWPSITVTLQETVYGFVLGSALGLVVGLALGVRPFLSDVLYPFITALNSIPRLALVPLFLLWFGLDLASKVALVVMITFFLVFYATYAGVRDVDEQLKDILRLMGAKQWQIHLKVTVPSAMSWIVSGFRTSVPYALVAAVTAEMIASNKGMGFLIIRSSGQFNTAGVFGGIVVLVVLGLALNYLVTLLERTLLSWKPRQLAAGG